jgi:hypothetical protein
MATVPTIEFRIWLPDGTVFTERAIGLSIIAAHYPQACRVEVAREPKPGMMMELW